MSTDISKRKFFALGIAASAVVSTQMVSGCASGLKAPKLPSPPQLNKIPPFPQIADLFGRRSEKRKRKAMIAQLPITHPLRASELNNMWRNIGRVTKVRPISDRRIRIHAEGTLFANENISEQNFFLRAADATMKAGYDGFVVAHLDYYSPGPELFSLTPNYNFSSRKWIGNYEDFLENRNEKNMFSTRRRTDNKVLDGVIIMMNKDDHANRDRFSALEIYNNFITYKAS